MNKMRIVIIEDGDTFAERGSVVQWMIDGFYNLRRRHYSWFQFIFHVGEMEVTRRRRRMFAWHKMHGTCCCS